MSGKAGKKLAILTIHGMGNTGKEYNRPLVNKLKQYVGENQWNDVHVESIYYQGHLQHRQEEFWNKVDDEYSLRWDSLRKFMLFSFSDAAAIEHSLHTKEKKLYLDVHRSIASAFDNCFDKLGCLPGPVIVIAQSLGCEQISNYTWDAGEEKRLFHPCTGINNNKARPGGKYSDQQWEQLKDFRRLRSCELLVTTGCNIPIFKAALDKPKVFKRLNDRFKWENYFDVDDVLGYPVKNLSDSYDQDWIEDKEVSVGGFLTGWNPASHGKYWTDKDVLRPIANMIKLLLQDGHSHKSS